MPYGDPSAGVFRFGGGGFRRICPANWSEGELKPALARSLCRREYHQAAERELAFCERNRIRPLRQAMSRIRGGCSSVPIIRM